MADILALQAEASTTTDPARLAAIAQQEPTLGSVVAANPVAYEALLDWLAQHGDDAAKNAVAIRRGVTPPPPPPAAAPVNPFAPGTPVAPLNLFAAATPRTPSTPRKRMSRALKRGLVIGIVGTVLLALVAGGGIAYVAIFGWPISAAVRTADVRSEPREAWGLINPAAAAADFDDDIAVTAGVVTVDQDRALVPSAASGTNGSSLLSLINTGSGSVIWTVDWEDNSGLILLSELGATPLVVMTRHNAESVALTLDAGNGEVLSENDDADVQSVNMSTALDGVGLGGDVLLRSDDGIGRYSATDLNHEKWFVDFEGGQYTVVRDRLIVGGNAYDLSTGEKVKWRASEDLKVYSSGHMLLGVGGNSQEQNYFRLDDDGLVFWSERTEDTGLVYFDSDVMVLGTRDSGELTAFDMMSGDRRWKEEFDRGDLVGGSSAAGIMLLRTAEDEITGIDLRTGDDLFTVETTGDLVGVGESVFYIADRDGLTGFDARTGDELWQFDDPDDYYFTLAGGNLVGVQATNSDDAEDAPAVIGLQP